jgi:hypothetical protein
MALFAAGGHPDIQNRIIPYISPGDQGIRRGEWFAADCDIRHRVGSLTRFNGGRDGRQDPDIETSAECRTKRWRRVVRWRLDRL